MEMKIKVRAWIPDAEWGDETKPMFYQEDQFLSSFISRIYMYLGVNHPSELKFEIEERLLQFIGLKDKNDVEIYEGDVVLADCREGSNSNNGLYEIIYDNTNCCFFGNPSKVKQKFGNSLNMVHAQPMSELRQNIEVVGNIYENPELLRIKDEN